MASYHYVITVFLDDNRQLVLFDYSHIDCHGLQILIFPTIPIRYK